LSVVVEGRRVERGGGIGEQYRWLPFTSQRNVTLSLVLWTEWVKFPDINIYLIIC